MFWQDWLTICLLALLVAIPKNLILVAFEVGDDSPALEFIGFISISQLMETLLGVLFWLGTARIVSERLQGRSTSLGAALTHASKRWAPGIWTEFLGTMIIYILLLALVVPGVIWFGYYFFSTCVVSLRGRSGKHALDDSKALVRGRWWAVAGRMLAFFAPTILAALAVEILSGYLGESSAITLANWIVGDLLYVFAAVAMTVLFLNLETAGPRPAPAR